MKATTPRPARDEELLELVAAIERIARSTRALVEAPSSYIQMYGAEHLDARKERDLVLLRELRRAWFDQRGREDLIEEADRGVRMQFAEGVAFYGACERTAPSADGAKARARALIARVVAHRSPKVRKLESAVDLVAAAIVARSRSASGRMPWKQIVHAWRAVAPTDDNSWREAWKAHRKTSEHRAKQKARRPGA